MSDGNADWVAQNLHRQRKILEEKQRQKRITSATIRSNQLPSSGYHTMNASTGFGFASPPCYDGPLSTYSDPDATGPTLVTIPGIEYSQNTVTSRPTTSNKEPSRWVVTAELL
ncbi:unnamed protein product [Haemonchus placei]|uniref:Uncharacterized protein n=1 Tax=Haemonchus placei TaxID=6290 RepID=A0A0N4WCL5_HAEPC|nr:unnamed protein product [Haemonchus placei]